jgi:hypothetical protein
VLPRGCPATIGPGPSHKRSRPSSAATAGGSDLGDDPTYDPADDKESCPPEDLVLGADGKACSTNMPKQGVAWLTKKIYEEHIYNVLINQPRTSCWRRSTTRRSSMTSAPVSPRHCIVLVAPFAAATFRCMSIEWCRRALDGDHVACSVLPLLHKLCKLCIVA